MLVKKKKREWLLCIGCGNGFRAYYEQFGLTDQCPFCYCSSYMHFNDLKKYSTGNKLYLNSVTNVYDRVHTFHRDIDSRCKPGCPVAADGVVKRIELFYRKVKEGE